MPLLIQGSVLQKEARVKEKIFRLKADRTVIRYFMRRDASFVLGRLRWISKRGLWVKLSREEAARLIEKEPVEVMIPWPARLAGVTGLTLYVLGHITELRLQHAIVSVQRYEFKTRRLTPAEIVG